MFIFSKKVAAVVCAGPAEPRAPVVPTWLFVGVYLISKRCRPSKLPWHGFGPCRRATFLKPEKPRHTASTAHAQRDCMIEDCSSSHPTSLWLSPHDRTENADQHDFALECCMPCVM